MNDSTSQTDSAPAVSIVIPTRSRTEILGRCLDALGVQTRDDFEIIVIDDGSTEDVAAVLDAFEQKYPARLLVRLVNETPLGANPSRNLGIARARGELVAFLDNDCLAEPEWLARLTAGFDDPQVAAVTGLVEDAPPTNLFELTFKGTHRVHGAREATRLVAGNMCVRRELLQQFVLDEDRSSTGDNLLTSGRGDEDGLFLRLHAAGLRVLVAHDAVVVHHHPIRGGFFFRQGYRSGVGAARLAYKYRLPPRIELVPLIAAWLLLPLTLLHPYGWIPSAALASLFLAAIVYNDLFRKRKAWWETLVTLPLLLAYYHVRAAGYLGESLRILAGKRQIERVDLTQENSPIRTEPTSHASATKTTEVP